MTREEAIERLEDTFEGWNMWVMDNDSPASKMSEALGMAISALREQEERSKGCEYCDDPHPARTCIVGNMEQVLVGTSFSIAQVWTRELKFCPMCGRRLEEV